jgi:hypothetical protein
MAEMQAGMPIEGVPMNPQMMKAMNDANASPEDGVVRR